MTPEERVCAAFESFDELLREGTSLEEALKTAATENGLKPENFRVRAEKELGDLGRYVIAVQSRKKQSTKTAEFLNALTEYIGKFHTQDTGTTTPDMREWLETKLGRELADGEVITAEDRNMKVIGQLLMRDVGKMLRSHGNSDAQN